RAGCRTSKSTANTIGRNVVGDVLVAAAIHTIVVGDHPFDVRTGNSRWCTVLNKDRYVVGIRCAGLID
ncbi:MAG: hypothetical protein ACYSUY_09065, partial [Planctomycetota bacterium]